MKRLISSMVLMLVAFCSLLFSGCGDPYKNVSLSLLGGQELVLTIGDKETETIDVDVKIENYNDALLSDIAFSTDNNVVSIGEVKKYADGISRVKISAIRGGKAVIKATMLDGGITKLFEVAVVEPVQSFLINTGVHPYVIRGGEAYTFNASELITFYPSTTTQTGVEFLVDDVVVTSVLALENELTDEIVVTARSIERPELRKTFSIDVLNGVEKDEEGKNKVSIKDAVNNPVQKLELALNHNHNLQTVNIEIESADENVVLITDLSHSENVKITSSKLAKENDTHKFEISFMGMKICEEYEQLFFVEIEEEGKYTYQEVISIPIRVVNIPQSIFVNNLPTMIDPITIFNHTTMTRGTLLNVSLLPETTRQEYTEITVTYDDSLITLKNYENEKIENGATIGQNTRIYATGIAGATSDSASIQLACSQIPEIYSRTVSYNIPIKVLTGAQSLVGDDSVCLSLSSDGEMAESDYVYSFATIPASAYVGLVSITKLSNNISIQQNSTNYNELLIRALSAGKGSFTFALPNGVSKTVQYEIISSVQENSLYIDMPTTLQNPYISIHEPVIVNELTPLSNIAIHKSTLSERSATMFVGVSPSNSTIDSIACSQTTIEGEGRVVEFIQNGNNVSLFGREVGKANVTIVINFRNVKIDDKGKQVFENKNKSFTFEVEVYIPVENFYYSPNFVTVADKKTVGFSALADATIVKSPVIYPANASYSNITYTMDGSDAYSVSEDGTLYNGLIRFNPNTGVIVGDVNADKFASSTKITAYITDHGNSYYTVLTVDIVEYEKVKYIVLDNIADATTGFTLSATNPSFQIKATAMLTTAHNRGLTYTYIGSNNASMGAISVSTSGLVTLATNTFEPGEIISGVIRIAPQDAYTTQYDASYYIDVYVGVETGSVENPYIISTAEQFMRIGRNETTLSYHYKIINAIDLTNVDFTPFGTLTGSIIGASAKTSGEGETTIVNQSSAVISGLTLNKAANSKIGLFSSIATDAMIKDIRIVASVDYSGAGVSCGIVCGDNYGTIENVSVKILNYRVKVSSASSIGGVVGYNRDDARIRTVIAETENKQVVSAAVSTSLIEVETATADVSVGGIVGINDGFIERIVGDTFFDANESCYSATISINAPTAQSSGGVVGKNTGVLTGLRASGIINGGNQVGGMVGENASSDSTNGIISDCITNCFVRGKNNVGGFAGLVRDGQINDCGVEIYKNRAFEGDFQNIVSGLTNVAGFAGYVISSQISNSYFMFFGEGNDRLIYCNNISATKMGAFSTSELEDTTTYTNCYSNATLFATSDEVSKNLNNTNIANKPTFPVLSEITIINNGFTSEDGVEKVFFATYYKAQNSNMQQRLNSLNRINITDFLSGISGACFVDSLNKNVVSLTTDGSLQLLSEGIAELSITSKYDISIVLKVYIVVVRYTPDIRLFLLGQKNEIDMGDSIYLNLRKNEEIFIIKGNKSLSVLINDEQIALDTNAKYNIKGTLDEEFLAIEGAVLTVENLDRTFAVSYNGTGSGLIKFEAYQQVVINGKTYTNETIYNTEPKRVNFKFYVGAKAIGFDVERATMLPNDRIDVSGYFETDNESEVFTLECPGFLINGVANNTTINASDYPENKFTISLTPINKTKTGEYQLSIKDATNTLTKKLTIIVDEPSVDSIVPAFYSKITDYSTATLASTNIIPGVMGLLKINAYPTIACDDYIFIENATTNPYVVGFELVRLDSGAFAKVEGAIVIANGLKIPKSLILEGELFIRTLLPTNVTNNVKLDIVISADNVGKTVSLYTYFEEGVQIRIKGKTGENGDLYVAKGVKYEIETNLIGYTFDQVDITSDKLSIASITKDVEAQKFYVTFNTFTNIDSEIMISISATAVKTFAGVLITSPTCTINARLVDYVINRLSIEHSVFVESLNAFVVTTYLQTVNVLQFNLLDHEFVEYDQNNPMTVNALTKLQQELNNNNRFSIVSEIKDYSWGNEGANTDLQLITKYSESDGSRFKALTINDSNNSKYAFTYSQTLKYNKGRLEMSTYGMEYSIVIIPRVLYQNNYDTPNPIRTKDDLFAMEENKYYILMNDLTLDILDKFQPITTQVAGFDGNNYTIKFENVNLNASSDNAISYGLFERVSEGATIQNVILDFQTSIVLTATDVVFGAVAGVNYGSITNCEAKGDLRVVVSESAEYASGTKTIGGLVGENYGYITNSRLTTNVFEAKGQMGGIVSYNQGVVSACCVKGTRIQNGSASSTSKTGGVVHTNTQTGLILGSFIEGKKASDSVVYSDNSNKAVISSNDLGAFIYSNTGKILNCYADIYVVSGSKASGFVYHNNIGGVITNSYSTSRINIDSAYNFAFVVENGEEASMGAFENCYVLDTFVTDDLPSGINKLNAAEFADSTNFKHFAFSSDPKKGVWTITNGKPSLISANNIITAHRILESASQTSYTYSLENEGKTENTPFVIDSVQKFEKLLLEGAVDNVNKNYYRLICNLDYEDIPNAKSALYKINFLGELEGNGMTISNIKLGSDEKLENGGLFASIGSKTQMAVVKDLIIRPTQVSFASARNVGTLAGSLVGGIITNVAVDGYDTSNTIVIKGTNRVGGIVGSMANGLLTKAMILNCSSDISVNATASNQSSFATEVYTAALYIPSARINTPSALSYAGGFVGYAASGTIENCALLNGIAIVSQVSGGIVGYCGVAATINKCQLSATNSLVIKGVFSSGGIAGYNEGSINDCEVSSPNDSMFAPAIIVIYCGGIAGFNNGTINECVAELNIVNPKANYVGGLVGRNNQKVINCTYNGTILVANLGAGVNSGMSAGGTVTNTIIVKDGEVRYYEGVAEKTVTFTKTT